MTSLSEARDAVIGLVDAAWKASPVSSPFEMFYDNVSGDKPGEAGSTTNAAAWARTTVRISTSEQSTQGKRRFDTIGAVSVQLFTPSGDGHLLGDELAAVVLGVFRGHVGSVDGLWFFNATPNEIGQDGPWFNLNVDAGFRFQESR